MKKIIILSIAILFAWSEAICDVNLSNATIEDGRTTKDIRIDVLVIGGGKPRPRPRTLQAFIEAELDLSTNQLWIDFNEPIGKVAIEVKNSMGQTINSYSCNTTIESTVALIISDYPDYYCISINGEEIEAVGYYVIY